MIGKESAFPENHDEELGKGQQIQDEELSDGATNLRQRSCGMAKNSGLRTWDGSK